MKPRPPERTSPPASRPAGDRTAPPASRPTGDRTSPPASRPTGDRARRPTPPVAPTPTPTPAPVDLPPERLDPLAAAPGHPGWDALLRVHLGEAEPEQVARVESHVQQCRACAARWATLRTGSDRDGHRRGHTFEVFEASLNARRRPGAVLSVTRPARQYLPPVLGALAIAVGVAALVMWPATAPPPVAAPAVAARAGLALAFDVDHEGTIHPGDSSVACRAGDRLLFRYTAPGAGQVVAVVLGQGSPGVTVVSDDNGHSLAVESGIGRLLPGTFTVGPEPAVLRAFLCHSEATLQTADVVAAAIRALKAAEGDANRVARLELPCAQASVTVRTR